MKYNKKICFFSTNRADLNYLSPIFIHFYKKNFFENYFVFNNSAKNLNFIKNENINKNKLISYKFYFKGGTSKNIVNEISNFSKIVGSIFDKKLFDFIFIIGDRYEANIIATIANIYNIPIIHVHGGEITEGSYDDKFRHSITKLSSIHFTSNEIYKNRVIQMGEQRKYVFCTGSPTIDLLKNFNFYEPSFLKKFFNINFNNRKILVSYNPVTNHNVSDKSFKNLLKVLSFYINDTSIFFSMANNDLMNTEINKQIKNFVKKNKKTKNTLFFNNVGSNIYLSLLKSVDIVIGNSSSGIIEAPYLNTLTINIGDRQKGRIIDSSIINIDGSLKSINKSISECLSNKKKFKLSNHYGTGKSIIKMHKYMAKISNLENLHIKKFNDINYK
tara:strand:- start:255 stop:1415 length:1161 start_codon:yes stop_codon:yes gene_type:complete